MSARFEVVTSATDQHFARFIAANGKEVWRTSETYKRRRGAINAIECLTGHWLHGGKQTFVAWHQGVLEVRYIDERVSTDA